MVKVGVIGLGAMGSTHLDAYSKLDAANVIAVADWNDAVLTGKNKAEGNIEGQAKGGFDLQNPDLKKYPTAMEIIEDSEIELVDICLPTPEHVKYAIAALEAGKHVVMEKPLARSNEDTKLIVDAASKAKGISMCALCMRFWPQWVWLKEQVDSKAFGKVLGATFKRVASHPKYSEFYSQGDQCGGGALDLHIHDTDFIKYLFGMPKAVSSRGYSKPTTAIDHLVTQYIYDDIPMVQAEGGWAMTEGFGFKMQYTVNFESATAVFDIANDNPLMLIEEGKDPQAVTCKEGLGYQFELEYMLQCIANNTKPEHASFADAAESVKIVLAEVQSVKTGLPVALD